MDKDSKIYLLGCSYMVSTLYTDTCFMCPERTYGFPSVLKQYFPSLILVLLEIQKEIQKRRILVDCLLMKGLDFALGYKMKLFEYVCTLVSVKKAAYSCFIQYIELFALIIDDLQGCFINHAYTINSVGLRVFRKAVLFNFSPKTAQSTVLTVWERSYIVPFFVWGLLFLICSFDTLRYTHHLRLTFIRLI